MILIRFKLGLIRDLFAKMKYVLGDFKLSLLLGIDYVQDIDLFAFFLFRLGLVEKLLPVVYFKAGHILELLPHSQPFI